MNNYKPDKDARLAIQLIWDGKSFFITGKAGTGKTTLLKHIVDELKSARKNVIVTAPTGVAAKNAIGVTIHSLLKLPLGPYLPGHKMANLYALNDDDKEVVRRLDVLIIGKFRK